MRISDWSSDVCSSDLLAIRISGDLVEQDKGFFYNPDNDVYFDRQKGHGLRGQIRLKRGPVDAIIMAETQRLTTPSIHYQIRSEERRVGQECVSTCRARWSPDH